MQRERWGAPVSTYRVVMMSPYLASANSIPESRAEADRKIVVEVFKLAAHSLA